ncbi:MAG: hypothetical protein JSS82_00210 [Bacteroidetes bacterium]|nr:hypothetical protein [Bacteroidota bacterium]
MKRKAENSCGDREPLHTSVAISFSGGSSLQLTIPGVLLPKFKTVYDMLEIFGNDEGTCLPVIPVGIEVDDRTCSMITAYMDLYPVVKPEKWYLLNTVEKRVRPLEPRLFDLFETIPDPALVTISKLLNFANYMNFQDMLIDVTKYAAIRIVHVAKSKASIELMAFTGMVPPTIIKDGEWISAQHANLLQRL